MSHALALPAALVGRWTALREAWVAVAGATLFRIACYAVMTLLALWNELRPAPSLPDALLSLLPYLPWVDRINYLAWLGLYGPLSVAFLVLEPRRWARYSVTGGLISLARGVCIALTGLGPPNPAVAGPGLGDRPFWSAYLDLLSPVGVFADGSARAYLTQDLFFSGHTATTFLLVLYLWRRPGLWGLSLVAHVAMVATVLLSHLHYSIDIVGAWAVTFAIFAMREWQPRPPGAVGPPSGQSETW